MYLQDAITVIKYDIGFMNKMLREGQYFFTDIEQEDILLYDAGYTRRTERKPLSQVEAKAIRSMFQKPMAIHNCACGQNMSLPL